MAIPVAVDITSADEMIYILCEIMRLESEWQDYRELYICRVDFELEKVMAVMFRARSLSLSVDWSTEGVENSSS